MGSHQNPGLSTLVFVSSSPVLAASFLLVGITLIMVHGTVDGALSSKLITPNGGFTKYNGYCYWRKIVTIYEGEEGRRPKATEEEKAILHFDYIMENPPASSSSESESDSADGEIRGKHGLEPGVYYLVYEAKNRAITEKMAVLAINALKKELKDDESLKNFRGLLVEESQFEELGKPFQATATTGGDNGVKLESGHSEVIEVRPRFGKKSSHELQCRFIKLG